MEIDVPSMTQHIRNCYIVIGGDKPDNVRKRLTEILNAKDAMKNLKKVYQTAEAAVGNIPEISGEMQAMATSQLLALGE